MPRVRAGAEATAAVRFLAAPVLLFSIGSGGDKYGREAYSAGPSASPRQGAL